ncbi:MULTISPECIES: NUDIX hydrolase [unclassified Microbacterium]|uniref:NUDIX hydrolase n=1 Tax=unclassified Microbacterium TaxID=2609290 RepID=UPI0021572AE0|nr:MULTISPECIES: NUDIX hydrolase [unclassified Microbacterium]
MSSGRVEQFDVSAMGTPEGLATVQHGERSLYENPWVHLTKVDITPPDGRRFEHHVVRLQRVSLALVLDDQDRVLMLWRYRFVPKAWGWELPGGIVDGDEDPRVTAERETLEETGWRPGRLSRLAEFQPMPGMVDTPHEIYTGRGAEHVGDPSDAEEAAVVRWVPLAVIPQLIAKGLVMGAGSLVGLLQVLASDTRKQNPVEPS